MRTKLELQLAGSASGVILEWVVVCDVSLIRVTEMCYGKVMQPRYLPGNDGQYEAALCQFLNRGYEEVPPK